MFNMYWPSTDLWFMFFLLFAVWNNERVWVYLSSPYRCTHLPNPYKTTTCFLLFIGMNINLQPLVNNCTCCLKYVDIISVLYKICQRRDLENKSCVLHTFPFQNCVEIVITVIVHIPYCSCSRVAGTINTTFIIMEYHYWFRELCNILFFKDYIYYTIKVGSSGAHTVETGFCRRETCGLDALIYHILPHLNNDSNDWLFPLETPRPWMNDTTSTCRKQIVYKSKIICVNCVYNNVNGLLCSFPNYWE